MSFLIAGVLAPIAYFLVRFIVKKLVNGSLNKFLFKNKNKAVNNGRKIGSKKSNSKLSS